jgi:hypothetical protein
MSADPFMLEARPLERHRLDEAVETVERSSRRRRMFEGAVCAVAVGVVELAWFALVALTIFELVR